MLASVGRKRANKETEKMIFALVLLVDIRRKKCSFKYYLVWRISIFDVHWFFTSARQPKIQLSSWYAKQQFLWCSAFLSLLSLPVSTYFCLTLRLKSPFVFYVYQEKKKTQQPSPQTRFFGTTVKDVMTLTSIITLKSQWLVRMSHVSISQDIIYCINSKIHLIKYAISQ